MPLLSNREDFDKHAGRMTELAIKSKEAPMTIAEIGEHIGHPVSEEELERFVRICDHWDIRCNVDDELWWSRYKVGV